MATSLGFIIGPLLGTLLFLPGNDYLLVTSPLASFEALITPYSLRVLHFTKAQVGMLFAGSSACTLLISSATPTLLRHGSSRSLLLIASLLMGVACVCLMIDHPAAFVVMQLAFWSGYAASQAGLFTAFNERYRQHPRMGEFVGWISAAGSLGRFIGPLWAVAYYTAEEASQGASASAAAPVWLINGVGVLLGALIVLAAWHELTKAAATTSGGGSGGGGSGGGGAECDRSALADALAERSAATTRATRTVVAMIVVLASYVAAATLVSPQVMIANRPPFNGSFTQPTAHGGGYCFSPPCDAYFGVYKPPWFHNPTNVTGTSVGSPKTTERIVVFYGYLLVLLGGAAATQASTACDLLARRRVRVWFGSAVPSCVAEIGSALLTLGLLVWWVVSAVGNGGAASHPIKVIDELTIAGATLGDTLNLLLSLGLLPIGKQSSLAAAFGLSWEQALTYHRWLGTLSFACLLSHPLVEWSIWIAKGTFAQSVFGYAAEHWATDIWPWAILMMEPFALLAALAALAACRPVRRWSYRLFYRMHLVLPLLIGAALIHSWTFWQYALPGIALYLLDKLELSLDVALQTMGGVEPARVLSMRAIGEEVVSLRVQLPDDRYASAGQVVYLHAPHLSHLEWHPFTISSPQPHPSLAPADAGVVQFHIKASGKAGRWTSLLQMHATRNKSTDGLGRLRVLGPFGGMSHLASVAAPIKVLVAGGVGITPISALAAHLLRRLECRRAAARGNGATTTAPLLSAASVVDEEEEGAEQEGCLRLVWVGRDAELFREYSPLLERLQSTRGAGIRLHLTGQGHQRLAHDLEEGTAARDRTNALPESVRSQLRSARPEMTALLPSLLDEMERESSRAPPAATTCKGGPRLTVFSCGPPALEASVRAACNNMIRDGAGEVIHESLSFEL